MEYNDFKFPTSEDFLTMAKEYNNKLNSNGFIFVKMQKTYGELCIIAQSINLNLSNLLGLLDHLNCQQKNIPFCILDIKTKLNQFINNFCNTFNQSAMAPAKTPISNMFEWYSAFYQNIFDVIKKMLVAKKYFPQDSNYFIDDMIIELLSCFSF